MSLTEKNRHDLYTDLCKVVTNEEAVQELLSNFPARDLDEPATRDHLRAGLAEVRLEITEVRAEITEVRAEIAEVRGEITEVRGEITELRAEMITGDAALEQKMAHGFATLDRRISDEIAALRKDVSVTMRNWTLGGLSLAVTASGVVTAIIGAAGNP